MARWSVPATSMATRAARWDGIVGEAGPLALRAHDEPGGRLHLDLDVPVEGDGERVEAGPEVGRRGGGSCAHTDTVLVTGARRVDAR